ncbi:hypothetical protein [Mycobacteroides abscessus]|uniref:hypothetical protein n=1 Tax=Mycobacteroides abscessus TaxID=36809 RepID=UPI000C25ACEF|nr:hypothetical protein [Mycobacteroides abscessus]
MEIKEAFTVISPNDAAQTVRTWILKAGRAHLCLDPDRSHAVSNDRSQQLQGKGVDELNAAIRALPEETIRWERLAPEGNTVILAALNTFLGRVYNDRELP